MRLCCRLIAALLAVVGALKAGMTQVGRGGPLTLLTLRLRMYQDQGHSLGLNQNL